MPAASESWTASSASPERADAQPLKLKLLELALELALLLAIDRLTLLLELKLTLLLELELLLTLLLLLRLLLKDVDTARDPCERHGFRPAPVTWVSSSALSWRTSASPFHLSVAGYLLAGRDFVTTPRGAIRARRRVITFAAARLAGGATLARMRYREPPPQAGACQPQDTPRKRPDALYRNPRRQRSLRQGLGRRRACRDPDPRLAALRRQLGRSGAGARPGRLSRARLRPARLRPIGPALGGL